MSYNIKCTFFIDKNGNHLFVVVAPTETNLDDEGRPLVDTFSLAWYFPDKISEKIKSLFPNSTVKIIGQFPTPGQNNQVLAESVKHDDVIFVTFSHAQAYVGPEHLTRRLVAVIKALQLTNRISTVIHLGNPFVLEELPHIPRYIIGGVSDKSSYACIDVLAGEYPAKGTPTYTADLK